MKHRNLLIITLAFISVCMSDMNAVNADISSWTDENGVRHYTNKKPPKKVRNIKKTDEIEYDPVEDMKRQRGLEEYRKKKYLKELNKDKTTPQITNESESESEEKAGKKVLEEAFQINEYEVNIAGYQKESWLVVSGEVSSKSECRLLSVRIGMVGENITLGTQLNKYIRVTLKDIDSSKPGIIDENVWVDNKGDQIKWTVSEINISCKER